MSDVIYNSFLKRVWKGEINLEGDTIKAALVTSAYVPDPDTHEFFDDVTNEVVGTGYVAGGAALANKAVTQDDANNRAKWDGDDPSWANSTLTARGVVLYKDTGVASTSPLIKYIDFGVDKSTTNETFKVQFDSAGIMLNRAA